MVRVPLAFKSVPNDFGDFLERRWREMGISQTEFAESVGELQSRISQIRRYDETGKTPPLEKMALWAEKLALSGEERDHFLHLAHLAHATDYLRQTIARLERLTINQAAQVAEQADQIADLRREVATLSALVTGRLQ
jgi:hypothetical protein